MYIFLHFPERLVELVVFYGAYAYNTVSQKTSPTFLAVTLASVI